MNLDAYLREKRSVIETTLERHLPDVLTPPSSIHEAMRYAVLGGGKRLRPILALAAAEACGVASEALLRSFSALELIHTYSLVHDDLPALDNDELRRGRKTTHVVYGEAMAILVGDALLTEAFAWLSIPIDGVDSSRQLQAIREVATAIGSRGMIGGQVADLEAEGSHETVADRDALLRTLRFIHEHKTGQLLTVSAVIGGILAGADSETVATLRSYGRAVGLAFQIVDDLLDLEESALTLGKTAGKDLAQGKLTYPALLGADAARAVLQSQLQEALAKAGNIAGPANYLPDLARYICDRRT